MSKSYHQDTEGKYEKKARRRIEEEEHEEYFKELGIIEPDKEPETTQEKRTNSLRWQRLRRYILYRDPICKLCNKAPSTEVDHIKALSLKGSYWDKDNLQGVCSTCHKRKSGFDRIKSGSIKGRNKPIVARDGYPIDLPRDDEGNPIV